MKDQNKVAGGLARAKSLTKKERSAIAQQAALTRYGKALPKAIAEGVLYLGDAQITCAVLDDADNTRVLTQSGFLSAIGRAKAKQGQGAGIDGKPAFLRAQNLQRFISDELLESTKAIEFIPRQSGGLNIKAFGYRAELLPGVCWVYQDAMLAGELTSAQEHVGKASRTLLKALTNHAINDLVDRATGFDDKRKLDAIHRVLDLYVSKECLKYAKMFDIEFYRQIYRLHGWNFDPINNARPSVIGHYTNDIYDRLAPGVGRELTLRVKRNAKGRPTQRKTQYLTENEGKDRLKSTLEGVMALMRISNDWPSFMDKLDVAYPKFGTTMMLPMDAPRRKPKSLSRHDKSPIPQLAPPERDQPMLELEQVHPPHSLLGVLAAQKARLREAELAQSSPSITAPSPEVPLAALPVSRRPRSRPGFRPQIGSSNA